MIPESDPQMLKVSELFGRGQRSLREAGNFRVVLNNLDDVCNVLDIDIKTIIVNDTFVHTNLLQQLRDTDSFCGHKINISELCVLLGIKPEQLTIENSEEFS